MQTKISYRLGLDLGANSLGWCLLKLDAMNAPVGIIRIGSRIFRDGRNPRDKTSLASARRLARGMRRRRDRFLKRRTRLLDALVRHGFMPVDRGERRALATSDPYALRRRGLDETLTPFEFGRAVFHLNQRRGFRSNRKTDRGAADDAGKIRSAIAAAREAASGCRTIGEWLAVRHANRQPVRARLRGQGKSAGYDLYVERDMIAAEFDALFAAQRAFNSTQFTAAAHAELRDILLFQRKLRPVKPGRCTFEPDEERAPLALPSVQRFRILQEVNHLAIEATDFSHRPLTLAERNQLAELLEVKSKVTFDGMRRALKLKGVRFNLESEKREFLKGNATSVALGKEDSFGDLWGTLSLAAQDAVVERLLTEESEAALVAWLMATHGLDEAHALRVADQGLPDGYGSVSRKALAKILPALEREVVPYSAAVTNAGYASHSDFYDGEIHPALPYYGKVLLRHVGFGSNDPAERNEERRYGKISNPTVHIGLNQVRTVVNAVIKRYGHPSEVVIEIARELKMGREARERIEKQQAENQQRNETRAAKLSELGMSVNGENLLRLRLWEELNPQNPLDRRCPYTGEQVALTRLFGNEVEIEHLLPFARTLDDGISNKTLCARRANRDKGNQTPFEAFGHSPTIGGHPYRWDDIVARAQSLPKPKRDRFAPDALERLLEGQDFLSRHLTDSQYLSRVAVEYLTTICPKNRVRAVPGRLTALLRGKWGLNRILSDTGRKERTDQRHHAVDAAVVGVTDRATLQQVSRAAERASELGIARIVDEMPVPWPTFRDELADAINRIVVSYKPDHGPEGRLHNDTAYGIAKQLPNDAVLAVHRVSLDSFTDAKQVEAVRDPRLRAQLQGIAAGKKGKELRVALAEFSTSTGVRRVRIEETLSVVPIWRAGGDSDDEPYKGYKGDSNYCIEIYRDESGRWSGIVISTFDANRTPHAQLRNPMAAQNGRPLIMRLCQDDTVCAESDGQTRILRVVMFSHGRIVLSGHHEGGDLRKRDGDGGDSFGYLRLSATTMMKAKARRVFIDPLGFVHDPGFHP